MVYDESEWEGLTAPCGTDQQYHCPACAQHNLEGLILNEGNWFQRQWDRVLDWLVSVRW